MFNAVTLHMLKEVKNTSFLYIIIIYCTLKLFTQNNDINNILLEF